MQNNSKIIFIVFLFIIVLSFVGVEKMTDANCGSKTGTKKLSCLKNHINNVLDPDNKYYRYVNGGPRYGAGPIKTLNGKITHFENMITAFNSAPNEGSKYCAGMTDNKPKIKCLKEKTQQTKAVSDKVEQVYAVAKASKVAEFSEAFGGATIEDGSEFTFPTGAEGWAGFANMNLALYPISIGANKKLTFNASVPDGGSADVRFRFEFNPYPNVNPAYDAPSVTITGSTDKEYSIDLPNQGDNTFSSLILYIGTRDVRVKITDVKIVNRPPNSSTSTTQTTSSTSTTQATTTASNVAEFSEAFGGATVQNDVFTFPSGAQDWAGFANMNTALYPITITNAKTLTFTASVPDGGSTYVKFRFEFKPHPDVDPAYDTSSVNVLGSTDKEYSINLPSQGANTFSSLILYILDKDKEVKITDVKIE